MKFTQKKVFFLIFLSSFAVLGNSLAGTVPEKTPTPAFEDLFEGFVYYADHQKRFLKSVKKNFAATLEPHELALEILKTLIEGPSDSYLTATWPGDTKINSVFLADDGEAYVDLNLDPEMIENMDTGDEILAIYSLVNSLTMNIPKIKKVKLLIKGTDAVTLAGHIDLEYFYQTNMLIVK